MRTIVCVGAALWGCFGCAGRSSVQSPDSPDSGANAAQAGSSARDSGVPDPSRGPPDMQSTSDVNCTAEVADSSTEQPYFSLVSGSFSGGMSGEICKNGAFAYLEHATGSATIPGQFLLIVDGNPFATGGTQFHFDSPTDATRGELLAYIGGFTSPRPGTYTSGAACGSIGLDAYLPATADCTAVAAGGCPPGCALLGPVLAPTCQPIVPEIDYGANATGDCVEHDGKLARGSWSLTLTSVDLYEPPDGSFATSYYVVHGSLSATLLSLDSGAALSTVQLALSF